MESISIVLEHPHAAVPKKGRSGDAGYDLCSVDHIVINPLERALVSTGISIAIPSGYAGFIVPRSGLSVKHGISIVNSPGLIDSNYRGEIKVILINLDLHNAYEINVGDRIAQLVLIKVENISFTTTDVLSDSERGEAGFGSSGY